MRHIYITLGGSYFPYNIWFKGEMCHLYSNVMRKERTGRRARLYATKYYADAKGKYRMNYQGILFDIDGVLHVGGKAVDGAQAILADLSSRGVPFRCISNTTRSSRSTIAERLATLGFSIPAEHIFTPAVAAGSYLISSGIIRCMLLTTRDVRKDFDNLGVEIVERNPEAVIVGDAGDLFTYSSLNAAFRALLSGAVLVALERDRYWMDEDGLSLSAGPFVAGLEYASGVRAHLVGKPSKEFFDAALFSLNCSSSEVLMVGDDIKTDIGGAQAAGLDAALVRTGKYREDVFRESGIDPDYIIPSVAHLHEILDEQGGFSK